MTIVRLRGEEMNARQRVDSVNSDAVRGAV